MEEKIKTVKDTLAKESAGKEDIESATKDLSETLSQVGQAMYGSQGQAASSKASGETKEEKSEKSKANKKKEKVEEGEVVE
ncbi:hypothetical protein HYT59_02610 [Candidatus Woesebacteria bacterium]|nr:hypothetical protein [Candidatus Woesebacteria bacterium]